MDRQIDLRDGKVLRFLSGTWLPSSFSALNPDRVDCNDDISSGASKRSGVTSTEGSRDISGPAEILTVSPSATMDGTVYLHVRGEIDLLGAAVLVQALEEHFRSDAPSIRLDLSGVTLFGAAGIRALQQIARANPKRDGDRVMITSISRLVRRVLDITCPDGVQALIDTNAMTICHSSPPIWSPRTRRRLPPDRLRLCLRHNQERP